MLIGSNTATQSLCGKASSGAVSKGVSSTVSWFPQFLSPGFLFLSVHSPRFPECQLDRHLSVSAQYGHRYRVSGLVAIHDFADVRRIAHLLSVDGDYEIAAQHDRSIAHVGLLVAGAQAGPVSRAAWNYLLDQHPAFRIQTHLFGELRPNGIRHNAQRRTPHLPVSREIGENGLGGVDRNRKTDARALLRAIRRDHGVDADDLSP